MSKARHFPAYDLDCEDADPFAGKPPIDARSRTSHRRIVERRVVGDDDVAREDTLVQCPVRAAWPSFDDCAACEHFKGYSLDPSGKGSFVCCGTLDRLPSIAVALTEAERSPIERTSVSEVMSDPVCVRGSVGLSEIASLLAARKIGGVPVVDDQGKPIGMITKTDLARSNACLTALEAMTPTALAVSERDSFAAAVALMADKNVHRVAVVSGSGEVVGIVSTLDVAKWVAASEHRGARGLAGR